MKPLLNLFFLCVTLLGFSVCLARALWAWYQPNFIPDFIRRMPLISINNRPNRWITVVVYMALALVCVVAVGIRMVRLFGEGE